MSERWLPVAGYEGLYEVSDQGRVRSKGRTQAYLSRKIAPRILKPKLKDGYPQVSLFNELGERRFFVVHRLVAVAFLPPDPSRPHVNHIDFDRSNAAAANLEWVTARENHVHSRSAGRWLTGSKSPAHFGVNNPRKAKKLTAQQATEIRAACFAGERQVAVAARFGISQATVSAIKRCTIWTDKVATLRATNV